MADHPTPADPIREAPAQALPVMKSYYEALGPCDHDVGICNCDMKRAIEAAERALCANNGLQLNETGGK